MKNKDTFDITTKDVWFIYIYLYMYVCIGVW